MKRRRQQQQHHMPSIIALLAAFLLLLASTADAFMLFPLARKTLHLPLPLLRRQPLPPLPSSTQPQQDSTHQNARPPIIPDSSSTYTHTHTPLADTHWTQSDPIAQLRRGEIPPFTWPRFDHTAPLPHVDKEALALGREKGGKLQSVAGVWDLLANFAGPHKMLVDPTHAVAEQKGGLTLSFAQSRDLIRQAAAGFHALGFRKRDHVSFFSENSARWLLTEQACALNGCPTAVRGAAAPLDELQYIYSHSESKAVVLQDTTLLKRLHTAGWLSSIHGPPHLIIILRPEEGQDLSKLAHDLNLGEKVKIVSLEDILAIGHKHNPAYRPPEVTTHDLQTLVYTSGTTGRPKGVMLSNGNILHQIRHISLDNTNTLNPGPTDTVLSLLPCWHIFERSSELFALARGASLVYSNIRTFKSDLHTYKPHFLIVVPRLLENVHKSITDKFASNTPTKQRLIKLLTTICILYHHALKRSKGLVVRRRRLRNPPMRVISLVAATLLWPLAKLADIIVWKKVRAALGGRAKLVISGGSALAKYLEEFYESAGITVVSGYGLTETSPVIAVRRADRNLVDGGVVGSPPQEVELQIRDLETNTPLKDGQPGVVHTRGPQVMVGYWQDQGATHRVIDAEGWFNTGDLGFINQKTGDLVLTGRAKDVIVLNNGENVEPTPIEDAILERCPLIDQVFIVGQDQKQLGALVVVNPHHLAQRGLLSQAEAERLASLVGPTPVLTGCVGSEGELRSEAVKLNENRAIVQAVGKEVAAALSQEEEEFRPWESVKLVYVLVEPFNVANGLLTQTLKTKRLSVLERYKKEVEGLYK